MAFLKRIGSPRFLRPFFIYKKQILALSFLGLLSSLLFLSTPYFSKLFIDKAFINKNFTIFLNLSIWGAVLFLFATAANIIENIVKNRINIKLKLNLANQFIRKFYSFDLSFFQSKSVGENAYRLFDIETTANLILNQCPNILLDIFKLLVILGVSLWINVQMTVFLLILSPLFVFHSLYLQKKLRPIYEEIWKYGAELSKKIHEAFSKILVIKVLGLETYQRHTYLKFLIKNIRLKIRNFRWTIINSLSSSFLSKAIYGIVTLYGGWLIMKGKITIGSYAAVMLYLTQLGGLLESLSNRFKYFIQEAVSLERFFEIMDSQPKIKDLPQARVLRSTKGEIRFKNVWFGYQRERPILKGLNFTIPSFSWVGIVGPSGCGKTTFISLVSRLYEPWEGEIFLDSLDLRMIKLKSLRERVNIVTQQPLLFDASIKENIIYSLKDIPQEQIAEACRIACIDDFINQLPQGYDTLIGEDACCLSQGLKQRVTIARALLRNPDLLILDEATSSVDSFTEKKMFRGIRQKRQGLSTIIVSHRLFSIKDAERIFYLRHDSAVEEGLHSELLNKSHFYREFFKNQTD